MSGIIGGSSAGGSGGVTDHAALTGLANNDHPQYETSAEAQAKVDTHAGTFHGEAHPNLAAHDTLGLATQSELDTHAGTFHGEAHPNLAAHDTLGLATQTELDTHAAAADPHTGYLKENDANWVDLTDGGATTLHSHAGGGGAGTWTTIVKTADETRNLTIVVTADATLQVTLLANTDYTIRLKAFFLTTANADLKYRMVFGGTTTRVRRRVKRTATTDIAQTIELKTAFDAADVVLSTTGLNPWVEEDILLKVGITGGLLSLQWAQALSVTDSTTCLEGSHLEYALS